ncbi:MAG: c-type cytochrome biogenesis protein CcmI [Xanthomonadales bacterium]|nr:c-type cytochrome biogenesis protein CcmI [Xanthomonadales bacterium]
MTLFIVLAATMLGLALAFLLLPLLRNREPAHGVDPKRLKALGDARDAGVIDEKEYQAKLAALGSPALASGNQQSRRPAVLASLFVAVLVPLGAIMLYQFTGEPAALDPARLAAAARQQPKTMASTWIRPLPDWSPSSRRIQPTPKAGPCLAAPINRWASLASPAMH